MEGEGERGSKCRYCAIVRASLGHVCVNARAGALLQAALTSCASGCLLPLLGRHEERLSVPGNAWSSSVRNVGLSFIFSALAAALTKATEGLCLV